MKTPLKSTLLILSISCLLLNSQISLAEEGSNGINNSVRSVEYFDPIFLKSNNSSNIDLTKFDNKLNIYPGKHSLEIYVNKTNLGKHDILFVEFEKQQVIPCFSANLIQRFNFNKTLLNTINLDKLKQKDCIYLNEISSEINIEFDSYNQILTISIPQIYLNEDVQGFVNPELWDSGISALFLNYTLNGYSNKFFGQTNNSIFGSFNTGLNLGSWYLRHQGNYSWNEKGSSEYNALNTYLQKDIPSIKSRLLIGEINTQGKFFNSVPMRGAQLSYVSHMLPQSQRGYAPDIRGVAQTNAKVIIRQNQRIIYEKVVSPGEFLINDLFPTGYGGDLNVTIEEADGTKQEFDVPYSSLIELLRPGMHYYSVSVGHLDSFDLSSKPEIYQGIYQRGLTNTITSYTGVQANKSYISYLLGTALSTPIGAIAIDVKHANTNLDSEYYSNLKGQSYQISFNKLLDKTKSNLNIAAYRYSTSGYLDFVDAMRVLDNIPSYQGIDNLIRKKNRFMVTLNQTLPKQMGNFFVTGYSQNYWNQENSDIQYQFGYSNNYNQINYNLSVNRVKNNIGVFDTNYLLGLTMPLHFRNSKHIPQISSNISHNTSGRTFEQIGFSNSAGIDNQFNYGLSAMTYDGNDSSLNLNSQYRSNFTTLSGSYSNNKNYKSTSIGIRGAAVAWGKGVAFSPYIGETIGIVGAKGAKGAEVGNYSGIKVDRWGHAIVPYLSPYEMNKISINPKGISHHVEFNSTSQQIAPYEGAVVSLDFPTTFGYPLLITTMRKGNSKLPFGATVYDIDGNSVGNVGQAGQVYARVIAKKGKLLVKWGGGDRYQCQLAYDISLIKNTRNVYLSESDCISDDIGGNNE